MKKQLIVTSIAAAVLATGAQAANNDVIEITGATAFRQAATTAINNIFVAGGAYAAVHDGSLNSGTYQAWRGTFGSVGSNVTVRTSWNGSVEGIRAIAQPSQTIDGQPTNANYILQSVINAQTPAAGGNVTAINVSGNLEAAVAEMSFSDVQKESTPIPGSLSGGSVGVVTFTMIANKTWRDDPRTTNITNVTAQQFRALEAIGNVPLSMFTGNISDTDLVYVTGRNDGSGTRTTYLAETGFGISTPVQQYVAFNRSNSTTVPSILLVPQGGGHTFNGTAFTATPANRSTVWSQDIAGNGGYSSGGSLRGDLAKTTATTEVFAAEPSLTGDPNEVDPGFFPSGDYFSQSTAAKLFLLTWLSTSDAAKARGLAANSVNDAAILGYEGVRLNDLATTGNSTLTAADKAKVTNGAYTAWGNEQLLYVTGNSTLTTAFNQLRTGINSTLTEGIPLSEMNVTRDADGGVVLPQ